MIEHKGATVELLFPTPVVFVDRQKELSDIEKNIILYFLNDCKQNTGNKLSKNQYVLEHEALKDLKEFCLKEINNYFCNFYNPINKIEFYVTQSWLSITDHDEYHHVHDHPNSILSGVFYIEVDEELDNITFFNQKNDFSLFFPCSEWKNFFAKNWKFKIKKNNLIIFPSTLKHGVDKTISNKKRISLAFNTFVKGNIGTEECLYKLTL